MNKGLKIGIGILLLAIIISIFFVLNKDKEDGYPDVDVRNLGVQMKEDFNEKGNEEDNKDEKDKEMSIEEKERIIESKKPQNKIPVELLKDSSSGKEYHELEDAPLQYVIGGVDFKLRETPNKISITKELTNEDIERIQGYGYNWHTGFVDEVEPIAKYGEYCMEDLEDTKFVTEQLIPQRLNIYRGALVGWITDSSLVYRTAGGYYGVSGVLQISYVREDNPFGLEAGKGYERDVEFRYSNTVDGLSLVQIIYLSDWKEIESWEKL